MASRRELSRLAQDIRQVYQHARRGAPDEIALPGKDVEVTRLPLELPAMALSAAGWRDEGKRGFEPLRHFERIWRKGGGRIDQSDHRRHLESCAGDVGVK